MGRQVTRLGRTSVRRVGDNRLVADSARCSGNTMARSSAVLHRFSTPTGARKLSLRATTAGVRFLGDREPLRDRTGLAGRLQQPDMAITTKQHRDNNNTTSR